MYFFDWNLIIKGLYLYLDMHAHSGKAGCFIYGNKMDFIS